MLSSGRSGLIRQKLGVKEQINEKLRRYMRDWNVASVLEKFRRLSQPRRRRINLKL